MTLQHKNFPDLDFIVTAEVREYAVDFKVYEGDTVDEVALYLHGFVKWDGCSNWHFDEQDNCMLHACDRDGPRGVLRFGEVMARCLDWTPALLPTWITYSDPASAEKTQEGQEP